MRSAYGPANADDSNRRSLTTKTGSRVAAWQWSVRCDHHEALPRSPLMSGLEQSATRPRQEASAKPATLQGDQRRKRRWRPPGRLDFSTSADECTWVVRGRGAPVADAAVTIRMVVESLNRQRRRSKKGTRISRTPKGKRPSSEELRRFTYTMLSKTAPRCFFKLGFDVSVSATAISGCVDPQRRVRQGRDP